MMSVERFLIFNKMKRLFDYIQSSKQEMYLLPTQKLPSIKPLELDSVSVYVFN